MSSPTPPSNINPANAITASRFLVLPVFIWAIDAGKAQVATVALAVCALMDLFDGYVARKLHCQTAFGEVFDAIADGACYGTMLVTVTAYGWVPWLPVVLAVALGLFNFVARIIYSKRAGRPVNYRSYAMERMVAYSAYLIGFGVADFQVVPFYWWYVILMAVVVLWDSKRMLVDPIDEPTAEAA